MKKCIFCLGLFVMTNIGLNASDGKTKVLAHSKYKDILEQAEKLYSKNDMTQAIDKMAKEIAVKLEDKNPIFVCVLNGAIIPMGQLMTRLDFPLQVDYIRATRYGGKLQGGELQILAEPEAAFANRVVVLVEDIVDTGKTLEGVIEYCYNKGAERVYTASLIDKQGVRPEGGLEVDFVGLKIPNKFIIGFGLDYEGYFRNLDGIYVMPIKELF